MQTKNSQQQNEAIFNSENTPEYQEKLNEWRRIFNEMTPGEMSGAQETLMNTMEAIVEIKKEKMRQEQENEI